MTYVNTQFNAMMQNMMTMMNQMMGGMTPSTTQTATNNIERNGLGKAIVDPDLQKSKGVGATNQTSAFQSQIYNPWAVPAGGPKPIFGFPTATSALMPTHTLYNMISDNYQLTSKYMSPIWGMPISKQLQQGYNPFSTNNQYSNNSMQMMAGMFMQMMGSMFGMDTNSTQTQDPFNGGFC